MEEETVCHDSIVNSNVKERKVRRSSGTLGVVT